MNIKEYLKKNKEDFYKNYTVDKKFLLVFNDKKIALFKFDEEIKRYLLIREILENNKFKKWSEINKIIVSSNSSTELLHMTSEKIN